MFAVGRKVGRWQLIIVSLYVHCTMGFQPNVGILPFFSFVSRHFFCIQAFCLKMILRKFEVSRCSWKCSNSDFKLWFWASKCKIFCNFVNPTLGWTLDAHSAMIGQFMWLLYVFHNFCIPFISILKKMVILLSSKMLGWH